MNRPAESPDRKWSRLVLRWAWIPVTAIAIIILVRVVDLDRVGHELVTADPWRIGAMLATWLSGVGVHADTAADARSGLLAVRHGGHDAVVLDVMLPDGDGLDVLRQIRAHSQVPVLMLTARGEETDRIVGLELGADDYLSKPFNPRELLARLRAVLRRTRGAPRVAPEAPVR
jgi:DNA-binding response OmpR family regulator